MPAAIANDPAWKLTFAEEWSTFSWNSNPSTRNTGYRTPNGKWNTVFPYGPGDRTLPDNGERQWYADPGWLQDPFSLTNNGLRITARTADPSQLGGQYNPSSLPYISGLLTTDDAFRQQYGYWEIRMRTPRGKGFWPALWLLARDHSLYTVSPNNTYDWPPEIDIMEAHGDRWNQLHYNWHSFKQDQATGQTAGTSDWKTNPDPLRQFQSSATALGYSSGGSGWVNLPTDPTQGFHTYAVLWDATNIKWYFDDVHIATLPTQWDMHVEMYLIIQLAVGGYWPGNPNSETVFPAHMDIDFVRVYSNNPAAVAVTPPTRAVPTAPPTPTRPSATTLPPATAASTSTVNVAWDADLTGTAANERFAFNSGGSPTVAGAGGDDTYNTTSTNSMQIIEAPGGGNDLLELWTTVALPPNVENLANVANYGLTLLGNKAANRIYGGSGTNDTIWGGGGDDFITLNGGENVVGLRAGEQSTITIADFKPGIDAPRDRMLLSGYGYASPAIVKSNLTQSGSHTVLTMDNGETITFQNTTASAFNIGNFKVANVSSAGDGVADNGWVDDGTPAPPPPTTYSIFAAGTPPNLGTYGDANAYNVGTLFTVTSAGSVTALKAYKHSTGQSLLHGRLWRVSDGAVLGSVSFPSGAPVGWVQVSLASPVALTTNTQYMVGYHAPGVFAYSSGYIGGGRTSGAISLPGQPNNPTIIASSDPNTMPSIGGGNGNSTLSDFVFQV